MKVSVKYAKISNQMTMGKRLERSCDVRIDDEMNGFGLDFVEKTDSGLDQSNFPSRLLHSNTTTGSRGRAYCVVNASPTNTNRCDCAFSVRFTAVWKWAARTSVGKVIEGFFQKYESNI